MVAFTPAPTHTSRPTLTGSFGMSASTHWLATATAQSVLERGGNAFDAAVAAGFVLHVVEPHLNGPGGDMVAIVSPAGTEPRVLVGQGPAPAAATIEHYRAEGLDRVPGSGALAATVPAAVEAWFDLLEKHGTWELADALEYAIGYARGGHLLGAQAASVIRTMAEHFIEHWPSSADRWLIGGEAPAAGTLVTNPEYAATLERLVAESAGSGAETREQRIRAAGAIWRSGFVAHEATEFLALPHRHSTGGDHAGVIDVDDFESLVITTEPVHSIRFRGVDVAKAGLWNQGPVLLQALAILDTFDDDHLDPSTALGVHTIVEAMKLAMADRDSYYGDGIDSEAFLAAALDPEYTRARAALIGESASHEYRAGDIPGFKRHDPPLITEAEAAEGAAPVAGTGEPTVRRSGETRGDTTHIDVVDRAGNTISATPSGGWLQSSPTIPGLGFCLGSRLQMTWLDEDSPSALRPGAKPRTTLSPTVLRDPSGEVVAALGTPGGDQQDQWQLLYLLRTLVGGYSPQQAIDSPMFHTTSLAGSFWPRAWTPGGLVAEARLGEEVLAELRRRGHDVTVSGDWTLGRLTVVTRDPATGMLRAAANPRGAQGYAAGR